MLDNLRYLHPIGGAPQYYRKTQSIGDLILQASEGFEYVAQFRGIQILIDGCSLETLPSLALDSDAMSTTFFNLIDNAVKFSDDNEPVNITGQSDGSSCTITITNRGSGIPPEDLDRIFTPYYRTGAVLPTPGCGIGLTVAKYIIEAHLGTINVTCQDSERKGNSQTSLVTFTVNLPLSQEEGS
jgi:signal transduction histidine kinase